MNRALPLILLIVATAGGLAYFGLQPSHDSAGATIAVPDRNTSIVDDRDGSDSVDLAPVDRTSLAAAAGFARRWDIVPMNHAGQVLKDARVTATRTGEVRTAVGRVRWTDAAEATWHVVVEVEGFPTWRRSTWVGAGQVARTIAYIGDALRVEGTLTDTYGDPVEETMLYFLSEGTLHPTAQSVEGTESLAPAAAERLSGVVAMRTDKAGRFKALIPAAGDWKLSVGPPGTARWTQQGSSELTHGGPNLLTATIPALASVRFECSGPPAEWPVRIRAYRFDAEIARQAATGGSSGTVRGASPSTSPNALQSIPQATSQDTTTDAVGDDADASTAPQAAGSAAESQSHAPRQALDPGWILFRHEPVNREGRALLSDMPGGEDLMFVFLRRGERIATPSAHRLLKGKHNLARVTLPAMGSAPIGTTDMRAMLRIGLDIAVDADEQEPGVLLTY